MKCVDVLPLAWLSFAFMDVIILVFFSSGIEPLEMYAKVGDGSVEMKCSILENSKYYLKVYNINRIIGIEA